MIPTKLFRLCPRSVQDLNWAIASLSSFPQFQKLTRKDSEKIAAKCRQHLGVQNVSLSEAVRKQHGQDEGPEIGVPPDIVVFPESTEHVQEVCKLCYDQNIPIIPHGTGTGLESGISALYGGICIGQVCHQFLLAKWATS